MKMLIRSRVWTSRRSGKAVRLIERLATCNKASGFGCGKVVGLDWILLCCLGWAGFPVRETFDCGGQWRWSCGLRL